MPTQDDETHALIQARTYDFSAFIDKHCQKIDEHILSCEECRKRMRGWSARLPMLFDRVVVRLPESLRHLSNIEQLGHLKAGQCLPCGCEVLDTAWTREQAREAFYRAFARTMEVPYDDAMTLSELTRLRDLPLSVVQLRRLRDAFWLPDGSLGTEEERDREEGDRIPQLPDTIGAFVTRIAGMHTGMSYSECPDHWSPY